MTDADEHRSTPGYIYGVACRLYHGDVFADGTANSFLRHVPEYYFITKGNTLRDEMGEHFLTEDEARARADALNNADVLATLRLSPRALQRRERLKALGKTFWAIYGEGHPETRWPTKPGRYAVREWSERYDEAFWDTYRSLGEVRNAVEDGGVERIVDLDTGKDVPFTVEVKIGA